MLNKLKGSVGDLAGKAGQVAGQAGDFGGKAAEMLQSAAAEFNAVKPLFAHVGYRVGRVQLEIGLSPKIIIQLSHVADADDAAFEALLEGHGGNRILLAVVSALRQASVLQRKVKFKGMRFAEVEVEVGIPPAVKLTFLEEGVLHHAASAAAALIGVVSPPEPTPDPPPPEPPPPESAPPATSQADRESQKPSLPDEAPPPQERPAFFQFPCPHCGRTLNVDVKYAGRKAECRFCDARLRVPLLM